MRCIHTQYEKIEKKSTWTVIFKQISTFEKYLNYIKSNYSQWETAQE